MAVEVKPYSISVLVDGEILPLKGDNTTRALATIDYSHHEVHEGGSYFVSGVFDVSLNNVYDFQLTTPAGRKWAHLTGIIETEAGTNWWWYENVSIVTPGTTITPRNANRNCPDDSMITAAYILNTNIANANSDTAITSAIALRSGISGSGKLSGGEARQGLELILKAGTSYSLRIEASTAGYTNFLLSWYEHTEP